MTAAEALRFWETDAFTKAIRAKGRIIRSALEEVVRDYPELCGELRGKGLIQGIAVGPSGLAERVCREAFARGLIMETSGPDSEVFKAMPALTIEEDQLRQGLAILEEAAAAAVGRPVETSSLGTGMERRA